MQQKQNGYNSNNMYGDKYDNKYDDIMYGDKYDKQR